MTEDDDDVHQIQGYGDEYLTPNPATIEGSIVENVASYN
jgi:hypothetical protein